MDGPSHHSCTELLVVSHRQELLTQLKHAGLALCRNISDKFKLFPLETDN